MKKRYIMLLVAAAMLAGCGTDRIAVDCGREIEDLEDEFGPPQDIEAFQSGPYHRYTYWYWRLGFARTFTWDGGYSSCETTDQNFPPSEQRPGTNPTPGA